MRYLSTLALHTWCAKIDRLSTNIPTISKSGLKAADENFSLAEIMCGRVIAALLLFLISLITYPIRWEKHDSFQQVHLLWWTKKVEGGLKKIEGGWKICRCVCVCVWLLLCSLWASQPFLLLVIKSTVAITRVIMDISLIYNPYWLGWLASRRGWSRQKWGVAVSKITTHTPHHPYPAIT